MRGVMRDGIYKVTLESGGIKGVVIGALRDGQITGCDRTHFVTGSYKRKGNRLSGTFSFRRHSRRDGVVEIANLDDFDVRFTGIGSDGFGELHSVVPGKHGPMVKATFRWIAEN
jgi:hypothetical protein